MTQAEVERPISPGFGEAYKTGFRLSWLPEGAGRRSGTRRQQPSREARERVKLRRH
ncbi:hypothetical protein PGTUg99_017582 [Puccinia graminis f. sp. tritici]|uniref:Uncharacterized protein n=1 Tax=Puccinia graminis f. sp. tritici TaxID=56615 RepID=A0A5B0RAA6_PUCGR|nr:hypothetical protein PGTUg99_017582 [Puccinia graminis f. sp. tritici]